MNRFCRYELRTTDVEGARAFYRNLLGADFWGDAIDVRPLPAHAAAAGAPAHWLGHIGVDDVVGTMHRFLLSGAKPLGQIPRGAEAAGVLLRDPFGAIVALTSECPISSIDCVAWHLLSTQDEAQAFRTYSELFGWARVDTYDLGSKRGRHVSLSWDRAGHAVGSTADTARLPHVHPQWLFFFRTSRFEDSLAMVRALGGLTLPALETATGELVAACDDPQGAAFGLYQVHGR
jgi:uncharacterized protein